MTTQTILQTEGSALCLHGVSREEAGLQAWASFVPWNHLGLCLSEYALLLFCPIVLKLRLPGSILVVCHFVLVILGHSGVLE